MYFCCVFSQGLIWTIVWLYYNNNNNHSNNNENDDDGDDDNNDNNNNNNDDDDDDSNNSNNSNNSNDNAKYILKHHLQNHLYCSSYSWHNVLISHRTTSVHCLMCPLLLILRWIVLDRVWDIPNGLAHTNGPSSWPTRLDSLPWGNWA